PEAARWQSPAPQAPRWDAPRQIAAPLAGPYPPGQPQAQRQYPTGPPTGMSGTTKAWLWIGGITAALVLLCLCAAILSSAQTGY
ncbi:MAG: hypothetical protein ACRDT4_26950, partial [Micromonosporaceae bacterium]